MTTRTVLSKLTRPSQKWYHTMKSETARRVTRAKELA